MFQLLMSIFRFKWLRSKSDAAKKDQKPREKWAVEKTMEERKRKKKRG